MKTEVYSWRVSAELKAGLEHEARRRRVSLSAVLDQAAREWLARGSSEDEEAEQERLHATAARCLGAIDGGHPGRSQEVRVTVRQRLRRKYGR
jgi:hypothetical protein